MSWWKPSYLQISLLILCEFIHTPNVLTVSSNSCVCTVHIRPRWCMQCFWCQCLRTLLCVSQVSLLCNSWKVLTVVCLTVISSAQSPSLTPVCRELPDSAGLWQVTVIQYFHCTLPPRLSIQANLWSNLLLCTGDVYLFIGHCSVIYLLMAVCSHLPVLPVNTGHLPSPCFTLWTKDIGLVTEQGAVIHNEIGADF